MSRPVLIVMRGLPGSGKTAFARDWQAKNPAARARVNSAGLRRALFMAVQWNEELAEALGSVRLAVISSLLRRRISVVCDDTNLRVRDVKDLSYVAHKTKSSLVIQDFSNVPLEACLAADADRAKPRGEAILRDLHERFIVRQGYPLPLPEKTKRAPAAPAPLRAAAVVQPAPDRTGLNRVIATLRPHPTGGAA